MVVAMLVVALSVPARARDSGAGPSPDPGVKGQLEALDYQYEVDEDGDFKLVFEVAGSERSQVVYVRSTIENYGVHAVREIWSPGYVSAGDEFPAAVANRLLKASSDAKLGGWVKQGPNAVFVVKIAADASQEALGDAIDVAITLADEMETELTPGMDDL